jgi:undecaprenyl diphosphate synthase
MAQLTMATPTAVRREESFASDRRQVGLAATPRHVALVPDGNRRWAHQRGLSTLEGHRAGARAIDRFIDVCRARGIEFVTVWPLTLRNLERRSADEVRNLLALLYRYVLDHRDFYLAERIRFRVIGNLERLRPTYAALVDTLQSLQEETGHHDGMTLSWALSYGGRDEIIRAVRRLIESGVPPHVVDEAMFAHHLDTAGQPDPELFLRTGGDRRLSGFLAYQAEYAELRFTQTLMPDLEAAEVEQVLDSFATRRYSQ